jgi:PAS domain S-box-containing protein
MRLESIRIKTAIALLAIGILIALVFSGFWIYTTYHTMKSDIGLSNLQDARLLSAFFSSFNEKIAGEQNVAASDPDLIEAIKSDNKEQSRLLGNKIVAAMPEANITIILDRDGNILFHSKGGNTSEFVDSGYLAKSVNKNGMYITGLYFSHSLKDYVYSIAVPVRDNGSVVGIIVSSFLADTVEQEIEQLRIDPTRNIIIVDKQGIVISADNKTNVRPNTDFSYVMAARMVRNGSQGLVETTETYDGKPRIVGYSPMTNSGWGALVSTPMNVIYMQIFQRILVIFVLLAGVALGALILSISLSRFMTDPIIELSDTMRKVSAGNYRIRARSDRKDEVGDLSRTFNSMMDELERNVELEHIVEMTKRYRLIFKGAKDPIFFVDIDGRIIDANEAASKAYQYTHDEIIHMAVPDFRIPEERAKIKDTLKKCFEQGCVYETIHRRKDGSTFPVEIGSAGTRIEDRRLLVMVVRDTTERKKVEGERETARDQAEKEKERAMDESRRAELYLDIMGHDINNLNQMAIFNLELIQEDSNLTPDQKESINNALKSTQGSANIIENVRKIQKIADENFRLEVVDINDLIIACIEGAPKSTIKNVVINYTPRKGLLVNGTPLLKEVFCNLIGNSVKYSDDEVTIDIKVDEIKIDGKKLYSVMIADTGHGIPEEVKLKLFGRFQRGTTKAHGKGLGLYIVKSLVERIGGSVSVEDRVKGEYTRGSKFIVNLPVCEGSG